MIKVENLFFTYSIGVEALTGISIEILDGEFIAIMGENGAGKTTLVKHFNGLLKPTKGEVYVNSFNTENVSVAELSRDVGLVFQNPDNQLFCETVEDEISFGLKNFGFDEITISKRVTWALNLLDLERHRNSSPFMLSGGERKRVALASVLAWEPKILILDEPTIGQDYRQKERIRQFIIQMNLQGRTVIVVTHDVEFVAECNPRVILMSKGKIIADDSARKILSNPYITAKASIIPSQIAQLFHQLQDLNFPSEIIDVYEAKEILKDRLRRG